MTPGHQDAWRGKGGCTVVVAVGLYRVKNAFESSLAQHDTVCLPFVDGKERKEGRKDEALRARGMEGETMRYARKTSNLAQKEKKKEGNAGDECQRDLVTQKDSPAHPIPSE